jgi:hypothetical protein
MVAAFNTWRYLPASSSAAFKKIAARDSHGMALHSGRAAAAAAIAWCTVATFRPPMTSGISIKAVPNASSCALMAVFSGDPGA